MKRLTQSQFPPIDVSGSTIVVTKAGALPRGALHGERRGVTEFSNWRVSVMVDEMRISCARR